MYIQTWQEKEIAHPKSRYVLQLHALPEVEIQRHEIYTKTKKNCTYFLPFVWDETLKYYSLSPPLGSLMFSTLTRNLPC